MQRELIVSFDVKIIDSLGVKLYTTIPPMIAELIANAWDADAHNVWLKFNNSSDKHIEVKDDGCGMSFDELNKHFLTIGRNRRSDLNKDTSSEGRKILGKKGLGKLSMFGIGEKITVSTIKNGHKTTFVMDYEIMKATESDDVYKPLIKDLDIETKEPNGTIITIGGIRRKTAFDLNAIRNTIRSRFHIFSKDFVVHINDDEALLIDDNAMNVGEYQFSWKFPDDFEDMRNNFQDLYQFGVNKGITGTIYTAKTPLRKEAQGIVLFSRNKLVQENKTFNPRGNDNFFQYMTGAFDVDFIDNDLRIDNCSTDRKSLAWDNYDNDDLVTLNEFMEKLVSITQSGWREKRKEEKKKKISEKSIDVDQWIENLNKAEQPLARKLTTAIIENDNIDETRASEYVQCIRDMYGFSSFRDFTQQLDEMQALDNENAIKLLCDWGEIEAKEYAKIALGRISTIDQFERYISKNASETKVIQIFLEQFPWLLDPKMEKFEREVTYSKLLKQKFGEDTDLPETNRRIDFLCTNSSGIIHIIELKRPCIKLTAKEMSQVASYTEFIKKQFPANAEKVKGYLISDNMTFESGAETIRKGLEKEDIYIKSYSDLLAEARRYNQQFTNVYEEIHSLSIADN
ncbi:Histidine kinase-, DNA gyrase B-, and HSP90-like ATPase [Succiniclasticum ruminis]|uniref:Histidine kinase-, DNA gyrase B-, and HSP90-like ATPase n=1 Tax=Succiniclasticum ruminis TaxID=40841 RepID=A0A1G6NC77_9FIRM|nr:ATP-binding protein [Succiniclasticum ruminis]SDC65007.1 Histidine kinase-, DNA gyrase B-, and HSP90-like ATPase [Succiniclasticum ruminis]